MNSVEKLLSEGHSHHVAGRLAEAELCYRQVLAADSKQTDALHLLGLVCLNTRRTAESLDLLDRCVRLHPRFAAAWNSLGLVHRELGRLAEAEKAHRRALELDPKDADAFNNLGIVLKAMLRMDDAIAAYDAALRLRPAYPEALNNLGSAYNTLRRFDLAIDCYRRALALKPDYAKAHFNESAAQLVQGNWKLGWLKYEFRWASVQKGSLRPFAQPFWRGDLDLSGKRILLHAEQGLGDTIQFSRFVPEIARRAGAVYLEVQPALKELCRASYPELAGVFAQGETLPGFDVHCPLLSLPYALKTVEAGIPSRTPYLSAPEELVSNWGGRLGKKDRLRVGFAWAGNCKNTDDRNRSISLAQFAPLLSVDALSFFSLQKDRSEADAASLAAFQGVTDLSSELGSFLDTAAVMRNLDLVVTVDTSVAHLAGALGVPVWILIQYSPDWRWLLDRKDSPWYPSARLFRQPNLGDWPGAIDHVRVALSEFRRTS